MIKVIIKFNKSHKQQLKPVVHTKQLKPVSFFVKNALENRIFYKLNE